MKTANNLFFSIFSSLIFFAILLLVVSNDFNFVNLILVIVIFLPLFLAAFWQGILSFLPVIFTTMVITFFSAELSLAISIFFILPALILSGITLKAKQISSGTILAASAFYAATVAAGVLVYYGFIQKFSIHNILYDTITFFSIYANQYIGEELEAIQDLPRQLEVMAFILPTILAVVYIVWLMFNYHVALHIAIKSKVFEGKEIILRYDLPAFYTYIFIVVIILSLITHNLLDNQQNLYYIFYNVLFILCFGYFYTGFTFLWNKIKSRNSFLVNVLYIALVIILFVELIAIFSILGFILEARRIILKR